MTDAGLRDRWRRLDSRTRLVVAVALVFLVVRTLLATQSGFTFHQGWNEGRYTMMGHNFLSDPVTPRAATDLVFNVTPLFPYLVAVSLALFGASEVVARAPSVLLAAGTIVATYALGYAVYDDRRVAAVGAVVLSTLPYFQLYGGRAQTDMAMVFFFTAALAAIVYGFRRLERRWVVVGGLLFAAGTAAKQPALVLPGVVLVWLVATRRFDAASLRLTGLLILAGAVGLVPLAAWEAINYLNHPAAFVQDWANELFHRTAYFANVPLNLAIGAGLGMTPPVLALAGVLGVDGVRRRGARSVGRVFTDPVALWLLVYGLFVMVRTPHGHQYYVVALTPPVALLAARGLFVVRGWLSTVNRADLARPLLALVLLGTLSGSVVLLELSGEYSVANGEGSRLAPDVASYLAAEAPPESTVVVERGFRPQLQWYTRDSLPAENVVQIPTGQFSRERLGEIVADAEGPVYVVYPDPAWGEQTRANLVEVHRTDPYRASVMGVAGRFVSTDTKFTYYLNDRRLVVYRVDRSAFESSPS